MSTSKDLDSLPEVAMPQGLQKTPLQRNNDEYNKLLKEGKINKDGSPKDGQVPVQKNKQDNPKSEIDIIKEYLATKTEYTFMVNGHEKTYYRYDTIPAEHYQILDIVDFHNRAVNEVAALERRRLLYQAKLALLEKSLGTVENMNQYDETLKQIEAIQTRFIRLSWTMGENTFHSIREIAMFLYQKTLEYCLRMSKEDFDIASFRSNGKLAAEKDIYGTLHVADACIDVEMKTYAYFQNPSKSS